MKKKTDPELDYKKALEQAAKSMILIHDPEVLIKMIVRMIVQKVGVSHAGILLYDNLKKTYVLTVSRGKKGLKIPTGFARIDSDEPLVRFFTQHYDKKIFDAEVMELRKLKYFAGQRAVVGLPIAQAVGRGRFKEEELRLLQGVVSQMEMFEAVLCVPSFFRDNLLGILFLGKKDDRSRFKKDELGFFAALASDVAMAIRNAQLFKELQDELDKRRSLFMHTTIALAAAVDAKDHYTHGHISRVTSYSMVIAQKLKEKSNLDDKFMENLEIASLLHDIGKIGTPERVLNKTDSLTLGERNIVEKHPVDGVTILQSIKELEEAIPGVKYHHERYDGSGYPEGLKGKEIPLIAAIIAVADTYDAMTTDRPYRKALSREAAASELLRCSGTQFAPEVVQAAVEVL